jgi:hypothetical protein
MAVLELTYNPEIIFPSMLMIVVACITTRLLCTCEGIFIEQLALNGKSLQSGPTQQMLSSMGVRSTMNTAFIECDTRISQHHASTLLTSNPLWLVINQQQTLLRASDLAAYIKEIGEEEVGEIDLLEIPAQRFSLAPIYELSTLYHAQRQLTEGKVEALFVTPTPLSNTPSATSRPKEARHTIVGIVTQQTIDSQYKL